MSVKFSKTAVALGIAGLGLIASGQALSQTTLTMSSWVPATHPLTKELIMAWGAEVEKKSAGKIKINMLPKAPANPPGTFDAVRDGLVDISYTVHGYTPGRFTLGKMAEFPGLGDDATSSSVAYQRVYERHLAKVGEHKGVHVITVFTHGPGEIYNTKKPIQSLDDLTGMKIRVGGGVINDIAKVLGVNALLKPAPESYEILSSGVADGVFFPPESVASFKLDKLIKYVTLVPGGMYNTSFVFMMNEDRYNKLARADKDIVDSLSGEHAARLAGHAWAIGDRAGNEAVKANNIPVITANAAFVSALAQRVKPIEEAWYAEAKAKGVDGAKVMAEFRAEIKKVAAEKR